ncbi:hypothetical protein H4Q26_002152 [Puccinia striiformis f. sp. tritici PST-130]|nr:hypothetical protein H4Q26_002152 [Puccinia striiformis f. sp. tritici PST-130]
MEAMHRTITAVNKILARIVANESHHKRIRHRTATSRCITPILSPFDYLASALILDRNTHMQRTNDQTQES